MNNKQVREHVLSGGELPLPERFPDFFVSLIKSGMSRIPACRPSFFAIYRTLAAQTSRSGNSEGTDHHHQNHLHLQSWERRPEPGHRPREGEREGQRTFEWG
eukprot:TRINITY_DN6282_c0_g1_i1.p1 TRINITY_DN6282_c0_g1~~TRINITY_DN6282_c0_g1_i1.p1  ORF type:complete len:102 (+),score=16.58 TRINITY_DN6282_c0_g1_i1:171-476(+)